MNSAMSLHVCSQKGETKASKIHPDAQQHDQHDVRGSSALNELTSRVHFPPRQGQQGQAVPGNVLLSVLAWLREVVTLSKTS